MEVLCQLSYSPDLGRLTLPTTGRGSQRVAGNDYRVRRERRRLRMGCTMKCMIAVTTAALVATRTRSGILISSGAANTDNISDTG